MLNNIGQHLLGIYSKAKVVSLKTDATNSDLISRHSIDSMDDESYDECRFDNKSNTRTTDSSIRPENGVDCSTSSPKFRTGAPLEDEENSDDDQAFEEDNLISSEDNNDFNLDNQDELKDDILKYRITLTETESVFPSTFGTTSNMISSNFNAGNFHGPDTNSLSRSVVSIASSLASYSGNLEAVGSPDSIYLSLNLEVDTEPAQYVLKMILAQFMSTVNLKIEEMLLKDASVSFYLN